MIEIISLSKSYKQEKILQDINLKIKRATISLLYGPSGSGKSTILSILAAITKPTSGDVLVEKESICTYTDYFASSYREKKIGFITQEFHLFEMLNVEQNIAIALALSTLSPTEIEKKVYKVAKELQIEHKLKNPISKLSGGEKQRCIIARALVNEPDILLCDEPTANLDRENSLKFITILRKLKKMHKTIIIATHDTIFQELEIVDNTFFIKDGKIE